MSSFSTYEQSTFKRKAMLLLSLTPLFISFSKFIISGDKDEWGDVLCFVPFSNKASSHPGIALSGISP
ncbi:hypothetical protein, partial [Klebsiella pneumoniae]|uniref:hypothetical protein n=1 Tax=Klebsiella pneumoniae TaxID=573 RepID=UPI003B5A20CE